MGQIDVSDVIADPDFAGPMSIVRRTPSVNSLGENVISEYTFATTGSIQSASASSLQRIPDALRAPNMKSFWVRGEIVTAGAGSYPDILVFNGKRFQVQNVFDWTNWGSGWSEGICIAEVIAP